MSELLVGARRAKILIDASSVTKVPDGLSTYVIQMIRHLSAAAPDIEFTAMLNPGVSRADLDEALACSGMKVLIENVTAIGPRRDLQMVMLLPRLQKEFDLIHIMSMTYPFALKGGICTIHDLTYRKWFHGGWLWRAAARAYLDLQIRSCIRRASTVIAVSEQTKADIEELVGKTSTQMSHIAVVHEGWEHMDARPEGEPLSDSVPSSDYLFFLGTNRAHKNLTNLLRAFGDALPSLPVSKMLVISGSSVNLDPQQRQIVDDINRAGERIYFTGFVSDMAVAQLFQRADALIFPSLKEGFGLPILEAFFHETPLLAAAAPAIPEVAGDAAFYFNPHDVVSMRDAILSFYADPDISQTLVAKGRERLRQFSWLKSASETATVYRDALEKRGLVSASRP